MEKKANKNKELTTPKEVDLYRDTPIRYLGYANEVGESFRAMIGSKWVAATYGVSTLYVLADTADKTNKKYEASKNDENCMKKTIHTATDTLLWQMLASVVIPGFTINRICAASNYVIKKQSKLPKITRRWVVTGMGLASIPFIIKPIDHLVDVLLDKTFRKLTPI